MGSRRSKRSGSETRIEAHDIDPQDAEAGDFPIPSPRRGEPRIAGAGFPFASAVNTKSSLTSPLQARVSPRDRSPRGYIHDRHEMRRTGPMRLNLTIYVAWSVLTFAL